LKGRVVVELSDLRYFVSIAETGSFTKSALQNNIAQSALSRRVRDIEAEMGVQLFYRNGRGVVLTEVGETFLTRARGILADMESLRQEMERTAGVLDGTVTFAVPPSVGLILLAPLLLQIRTDHPRIKMRVLEDLAATLRTGWPVAKSIWRSFTKYAPARCWTANICCSRICI